MFIIFNEMSIVEYLEEKDSIKYQSLINIFDIIEIHNNQNKIKSLFYLRLNISNNHKCNSGFFMI